MPSITQPGDTGPYHRTRAVERTRKLLLRRGMPRVQMSLILLVTGCAGFLGSYALLHVGMGRMSVRYPLAILLAYAVFLLLLRGWLFLQQRHERVSGDLGFDLPGIEVDLLSGRNGGRSSSPFRGSSSDAGGAGAGGSWTQSLGGGHSSASGGGIWDSATVDLDLGEGWLVVLALIAIAITAGCGLIATAYFIYAAPSLLAEVLVDGLLIAGLCRRLQRIERRHWLRSVVRRTCVPAVLLAVVFALSGYLMQLAAPEARSIGGFWQAVSKRQTLHPCTSTTPCTSR